MVAFPFCKINLGLNVVARRPDGYHNLVTCFFPVPWTDILEIIPSKTLSFTATGLPIPGRPEDNLCLKAYFLLQEKYKLPPVAFHLHKIVPIGSGLGGGSSDAAFSLKLLDEVFGLGLSAGELRQAATTLGSDCAFFLQNAPAIGRGRGEQLEPAAVSLHGKFLLIVVPSIHISTAEAFEKVVPQTPPAGLPAELLRPVSEWKHTVVNDFEPVVFRRHPHLSRIKDQLYAAGALYAGMTGSGAALFGIFDRAVASASFQGCTCWSGTL